MSLVVLLFKYWLRVERILWMHARWNKLLVKLNFTSFHFSNMTTRKSDVEYHSMFLLAGDGAMFSRDCQSHAGIAWMGI